MLATPSSHRSVQPALSAKNALPQLKKYELWNGAGVLVLNIDDSVLTLLHEGELLAQCKFSASELYVCALLLAFHPTYVPIEELLAILIEKPVKDCLMRLNEAAGISYDLYHQMTMPVRRAISSCRKLLVPFGIDIHAIDMTGYELRPLVIRGQR
jgi:hypothetical protein